MIPAFVVIGAMVGAPLRYVVDRAFHARDLNFPWGTFVVNAVGSGVLGGLVAAAGNLSDPFMALVGAGFCGALTTYSTFAFETLCLLERRQYRGAVAHVLGGAVLAVAAAILGYVLVDVVVAL